MTKYFTSSYDRRRYCLDQAQRLIDVAISATPTGDLRNELTDINITLLDLMERIEVTKND